VEQQPFGSLFPVTTQVVTNRPLGYSVLLDVSSAHRQSVGLVDTLIEQRLHQRHSVAIGFEVCLIDLSPVTLSLIFSSSSVFQEMYHTLGEVVGQNSLILFS
jgi:hypothetical protein